ncbi:MAG: hypothetical protein H5T62_04430 [Anaerolineae bacterium]|nr:hypothetical protein [Anaerolineae bacterium]
MRKVRHWALIILGVGSLLLGLIGLASLGAYALTTQRQQAITPWQDPTTTVRERSIAPDLALLPLAGVDEAEAISRALLANELETAYSLLVYSASLSDGERAGKWLLLGQRYQESGDVERARLSYRMAADIATLSPFMTDLARAQTLLQAGTGLVAIRAYGDGVLICDQARDVATYSPHLTPAHRQQILQGLQAAYTTLGLGEGKWLELARLVSGSQTRSPQQQEVPTPTIPPLPANDEVRQAEVTRQTATEQMLVVLVPPQREPSRYLLDALTQALLAEDRVKQEAYGDEAIAAADLPTQVALAQARVQWLTLKLSIARQATGLSLVPDWEAQETDIREQLQAAQKTLYELLTLYTEDDRLTLVRQQLLAGRLGLYPDYPEETLLDELQDAQALSVSPLHLQVLTQKNSRLIVLAGKK